MQSNNPVHKDGHEDVPEVSVELLGPVSSLKGHDWPRGRDLISNKESVPLGLAAVDRPHALVLRLPNGRTLQHISKGTIFGQYKGIVEDAELSPHPDELQFQAAIKILELIFEEWDVHLDPRSDQELAKWKTAGDLKPYELAEYRGHALLRGEDKVDVTFQIRPSKTGWLLWIMVGATMEERGRLHGTSPASQPATRTLDSTP
jgi:hypothetical protein